MCAHHAYLESMVRRCAREDFLLAQSLLHDALNAYANAVPFAVMDTGQPAWRSDLERIDEDCPF